MNDGQLVSRPLQDNLLCITFACFVVTQLFSDKHSCLLGLILFANVLDNLTFPVQATSFDVLEFGLLAATKRPVGQGILD